MKSHHAAALAIVVWYLIMPPALTWESKETQLADILSEHWIIIETHTTEKLCRVSLDRLTAQALSALLRKDQTFRRMQWMNRRLAADCVDDSDPRIKTGVSGEDFATQIKSSTRDLKFSCVSSKLRHSRISNSDTQAQIKTIPTVR